jgi:hypothetical protein
VNSTRATQTTAIRRFRPGFSEHLRALNNIRHRPQNPLDVLEKLKGCYRKPDEHFAGIQAWIVSSDKREYTNGRDPTWFRSVKTL